MSEPKIVHIPNVPAPTRELCYISPNVNGSQGNPMRHCDRAKGHGWLHSWEAYDLIESLKTQLGTP